MPSRMDLLVFGDQAVNTYPFLKAILRRGRTNNLLNSFIAKAGMVLREEISQLSSVERESIPSFSTIRELADNYHEGRDVVTALDSALLTVAQLAHYIGCTAETPSQNIQKSTTCIGLCTGSLAAAAVASSPSAVNILPLAIEVVKISFRTGLYVSGVAQRVHQTARPQESWAFLVSETTEIEAGRAIQEFNREKVAQPLISLLPQACIDNVKAFPTPSTIYISSVGPGTITINGPPSTLKVFFESSYCLRNSKRIQIPIYGPYHAPHLHIKAPIEQILTGGSLKTLQIIDSYQPQMSILSTATGSLPMLTTTRQLIEQSLKEILVESLRFDRLVGGCVHLIKQSLITNCFVQSIGPSNSINAIISALRFGTDADIFLGSYSSWASEKLPYDPRGSANPKDSKIAIVGMAGRFPGAADHEKLWELLEAGLDVHREVPSDRFDPKTHTDPSGKTKNTSHTPYGCFIDNPGSFDPRFFNMSPREAMQTDPMQRLALVTAYEALEMSGYVPNRTPSTKLDRIGTFYGGTSDDWREINAAQDVDTYFITGGVRAFGPGRINYHFKFSGPSLLVDTACSSSMAAIQVACTSLWAGECDTAVAGGVNVMTNPDIFAGLSRGQFLSKTGPCQTFDNDADGYCRADGVATVILKRLEDAQADNDTILAVILGSATNHSADAISITHPHGTTQELLYSKILAEAGVDALDVDYVEMHGTGTQAGDGTEMLSVTNVFAPRSRQRRPSQVLYLGAVKANVGHGEAASGVTALIKCLLMMQKNAIPPHVGIKKSINQNFPTDLKQRNVHIALKKQPWKAKSGKGRLLYVNNFSAAGGNTGLLVEDAPPPVPVSLDPRSTHIIAVTAKAKSSLKKNIERLIAYIDHNPSMALSDLSYTLTARRMQYNYRVAFPANCVSEARAGLIANLDDQTKPISATVPGVILVFTGQGAHYAALGMELLAHSRLFKSDILAFSDIAVSLGYPSILPLMDGSISNVNTLSAVTIQVGLVCIQMALAHLWISWGIKPNLVIGHSLGEYAALNVAGVISASDAIFLVGERARFLQDHCTINTHAMLAVRAPLSSISDLPHAADSSVEVACINGPQDTVLSGTSVDIDKAAETLNMMGIKCTKLNVPFAFHSSQVDSILVPFEHIASSVIYNKAQIPVISPLLGDVFPENETIDSQYLRRHARAPVNFLGAVESARRKNLVDETTLWIEIGPHPVCLNMVKSILGTSGGAAPTLRRGEDAWKTIANSLCILHKRGLDIRWGDYHCDFQQSLRMVDIPKYAFDEKTYWIQYTNDWCLTKGDAPNPVLQPAKSSALSTTTVHTIIEETIKDGVLTMVVESDLARPDLNAAVVGHLVNGAGLCPSSIYADMALTVADYMYRVLQPQAPKADMNVRNMEVVKPLIAKLAGPQILRLSAVTDISLSHVNLIYSSGEGKTRIEHAKCVVSYGDSTAWLSEWQRNAYLVQGRIDGLRNAVATGGAQRIFRGLAYKLFAALVHYDQKYQGMEEVIFDSGNLEATASISFQTKTSDGSFFCSPYWIDSVAHLSGFIVNGSDGTDSANQVYVSHGWESLRIAKPLSAEKSYRSYVKMQPAAGKMVTGDVFVFEGETIVALVGGLKFQCIPRTVLNSLLPPAGISHFASAATKTLHQSNIPLIAATTKTEVIVKQEATATQISVTALVLSIIAEEVGISTDELEDAIDFANLGVDSLMSLSISGRMREELDLEVPSSVFMDYPTIGSLKGYLSQFTPSSPSGEVYSSSELSLPGLDLRATTPDDGSSSSTGSDELRDENISSVPSPLIMGESQEIIELPQRTSILIKSDMVIAQAWDSGQTARLASSVLLQGNPKRASKFLFLFPDGGGSATSYVSIPNISPEIAVYGLNSPFMKTPKEYDNGVSGITSMFLVELRRKQPYGPYYLGGWSAGGVVAFEAAQQLIQAGEIVERLILIDAPCPLIIEPLPSSLHQFFNSIGLLGDGLRKEKKTPAWLLPHFASSVAALSTYTATTMPPGKAPKTLAIWCEDGVCKYPEDPRPDPYPYGHAQWLLENRSDFGPNLWDRFIGVENMEMKRIGGNHFTMMREPHVSILRDLIRQDLLE